MKTIKKRVKDLKKLDIERHLIHKLKGGNQSIATEDSIVIEDIIEV